MQTREVPESGWAEHGDTRQESTPGRVLKVQGGAREATQAVDDRTGVRACAPPIVGRGGASPSLPGHPEGTGGQGDKRTGGRVAHTSGGVAGAHLCL